jgi:hypothetical protein
MDLSTDGTLLTLELTTTHLAPADLEIHMAGIMDRAGNLLKAEQAGAGYEIPHYLFLGRVFSGRPEPSPHMRPKASRKTA